MSDLDRLVVRLLDRAGAPSGADLIWTNPLGGRTYRVEGSAGTCYLKVSPAEAPASHDLVGEAERSRWIGDRLPVPVVIDTGRSDAGSWLLTQGLPGTPASDARWQPARPQIGRALGRAVRHFHDQLAGAAPDCPWDWTVAERVARAGTPAARAMAAAAPPETDRVVAHGDLCLPNILLDDDAELAGFCDLGKLGVADRAADLGCHVWSLDYNGLGDLTAEFLAGYGYDGDPATVLWYRDFYTVA